MILFCIFRRFFYPSFCFLFHLWLMFVIFGLNKIECNWIQLIDWSKNVAIQSWIQLLKTIVAKRVLLPLLFNCNMTLMYFPHQFPRKTDYSSTLFFPFSLFTNSSLWITKIFMIRRSKMLKRNIKNLKIFSVLSLLRVLSVIRE